MKIIFIGLSLSSSWGNGHATTYRALLKALNDRGNTCLFYEYDAPWYRENRDMETPDFAELRLYEDTEELKTELLEHGRQADAIVLGSYVQGGIALADWLTETLGGDTSLLFYDIDTPVTLRALAEGNCEYLAEHQLERFDAYLSFSGGKALELLEQRFGARRAVPFHCSADPEIYYPETVDRTCSLGYLGTYSKDRHDPMVSLLFQAAERLPDETFEVVGPQYPDEIVWPKNVTRREHLPPSQHRSFYCSQRFTLNLTRSDMVVLGHSPSVRLFEAAACGVPVISDCWQGIEDYFKPGEEILLARNGDDVARYLREIDEEERKRIGERARARFLSDHSPDRRAAQLEQVIETARTVATSGG